MATTVTMKLQPQDDLMACPRCTGTLFELHDEALNAAKHQVRLVNGAFEIREPIAGQSAREQWRASFARVACIACRQTEGLWAVYDLSQDGELSQP